MRVTTELGATRVRIAEPFELTWTVSAPPKTTVAFPEIGDELGKLTVIAVRDSFDLPAGDQRRWIRSVELESYVSGTQRIPPVQVAFTIPGPRAEVGVLRSAPVEVHAESAVGLLTSPSDFRDIEGPVSLPQGWEYWTALGALAVIVAAGAWFAAGRWFRAVAVRSQPPAIWALKELDRFEHRWLRRTWEAEPFHSELAAIIREYLQRRFGLSRSLTTTELRRRARNEHGLETGWPELEPLLATADLAKFALFGPSLMGGRDAVETARQFVRNTAGKCRRPAPRLDRQKIRGTA